MSNQIVEQDITAIARMGKQELKREIRNFHGRFKLDFTDDYLEAASEDLLRHILFAAFLSTMPRH